MATFLDNESLNSSTTRSDVLDFTSRALLITSGTLAAVELGLMTFSDSRRLKLVGFIAPILTLAIRTEIDQVTHTPPVSADQPMC